MPGVSPLRIFQGFAILTATAAGLMVVAGGYIYVASERIIHRKYALPLTEVAVPSDSATVAEGRRLAAIRG